MNAALRREADQTARALTFHGGGHDVKRIVQCRDESLERRHRRPLSPAALARSVHRNDSGAPIASAMHAARTVPHGLPRSSPFRPWPFARGYTAPTTTRQPRFRPTRSSCVNRGGDCTMRKSWFAVILLV